MTLTAAPIAACGGASRLGDLAASQHLITRHDAVADDDRGIDGIAILISFVLDEDLYSGAWILVALSRERPLTDHGHPDCGQPSPCQMAPIWACFPVSIWDRSGGRDSRVKSCDTELRPLPFTMAASIVMPSLIVATRLGRT